MTTKKVVKTALRFALGAKQFACDSCRDEMMKLLQDIGTTMRDNQEAEFKVVITPDGHFQYQVDASIHSGIVSDEEKAKIRKEKRMARKAAAKEAKGGEAVPDAEEKDDEEDDEEEEIEKEPEVPVVKKGRKRN